MAEPPLLPAEKAFLRLVVELAGNGLFCRCCDCSDRDGMQQRLLDAFDAAMAEVFHTCLVGRVNEQKRN